MLSHPAKVQWAQPTVSILLPSPLKYDFKMTLRGGGRYEIVVEHFIQPFFKNGKSTKYLYCRSSSTHQKVVGNLPQAPPIPPPQC